MRVREPDRLPCSSNWRAIKAGFQTFADGICWGVGNGERINVWFDSWIKGSFLRELIEGPLTQRKVDMKVSEFLLDTVQGWKWEALSFELPESIMDRIKAIPRQLVGRREDVIVWKLSKDGEFTTKSAYAWLNRPQQIDVTFQGKWIWKIDTLPKIINFLWLCMHNSLLVKAVLAMRGIIQDSSCPLCNNSQETIRHLLIECVVAKEFWHKLMVPPEMVSSFVDMDLFCWLKANCQSKVFHSSSVPWTFLFSFAIWNLWKHRNGMVFNNNILNVNLHSVSKSQVLE